MPVRHKNNREPASPIMIAALAATLLFATGVLFVRLIAPTTDVPDAIVADAVSQVETEAEVWRDTSDELTDIQEWTNKITSNPDNYYNYYRRGQAYYDDGAYDDASVDFTTAISLSTNHANSYLYRCYTYNELDYFARALEDCQTVLEIDPDSASAYNSKGIAHYGLQDYDAALQAYSKALDISPSYTYALNNRGLVHLVQGNYNAAIADYTASLEHGNSNPYIPYGNRGDAYFELGQYRNAIADYDAAIADNPNYASNYLSRGLAHEQLENHDAAIEDYYGWITRMTTTRSDYRFLQNGITQTFAMTEGQLYNISYNGEAGTTITISATGYENGVDPIMVLTYQGREILDGNDDRILDEDFDAEISNFTLPYDGNYILMLSHAGGGSEGNVEVLVTIDDNSSTMLTRPSEYLNGITDNGIEQWTTWLDANSDDARGFIFRGNLYQQQENYDAAFADYTTTLALNPEHAWARLERCRTYHLMNDDALALEDCEQVTDSKHAIHAHYEMGRIYSANQQYSQALVAFEAAITAYDQSNLAGIYETTLHDTYLELGKIHTELADYDAAITWFTRAINLSQFDQYMAYAHRGDVRERIGNQDLADADYAAALDSIERRMGNASLAENYLAQLRGES